MSLLKNKKALLMSLCLLGSYTQSVEALCLAKNVVPGVEGLPSLEVIQCAKDPSNTNVRQTYKNVFCTPTTKFGLFSTNYPIIHDIISSSKSVKADDALLVKIANTLLSQPVDTRYVAVRGLLYKHPLDFLRKQLMLTNRLSYADIQATLAPEEMARGDAQELAKVRQVKEMIEENKLQNSEPYKSLYAIASKPVGPSGRKNLTSNPGSLLLNELLRKIEDEMNKAVLTLTPTQLADGMRNGVFAGVESKADIFALLFREHLIRLSGGLMLAETIKVCESIK